MHFAREPDRLRDILYPWDKAILGPDKPIRRCRLGDLGWNLLRPPALSKGFQETELRQN